MTTNTFKVTYASGATSETNSTCHSVEAFCNEHFGSAWETAKENGATIVMTEGVAPAPEPQDNAGEFYAEPKAAAPAAPPPAPKPAEPKAKPAGKKAAKTAKAKK